MVEPDMVIHWFRRDLRIADNLALNAAIGEKLPVIPVYILSDWKGHHAWTGANRQQFLCGCLASLAKDLKSVAGQLVIRQGAAVGELRKLIQQSDVTALHYNKDPDPFGKAVEQQVERLCEELGVRCHGHSDAALHGPDEVLTKVSAPYKVFTPYSRNWLGLDKAAPLSKVGKLNTPDHLHSLPLPDVSVWGLHPPTAKILPPGEKAALGRLEAALREKIGHYAETRDFPALSGTSRLSQDLRYGLISIRTVFAKATQARESANAAGRKNIDVFIKELAWREFYFAILHHFPNVLEEEFNPDWRGLPWDEPGERFEAWKAGRTGFPIVDAGMRELLGTGFMHNRVRMITAMFLTKDLHIDWRLGESWFMQNLTDGEIASNNGGWQWSAGTGADAAPYFRIQNPWTQTARYDPDGTYIKRWIPELKNVSPKLFLAPPANGRPIAADYPLPIVDHKTERERTLQIFKRHRQNLR
jgi:deoxyribodipyrimidine photo-lyase